MTTLEQKIDRLQASVDALAKILAAHSPAPAVGLVAVYERERDKALVKTLTARKTRARRV